MTVETALFDALKGMVGNRVYPDIAPADSTMPYITYQQVGGEAVNYLDDMLPDQKNGRFQVNVWGVSRSNVSALTLQVESAIRQATAFQARPIGAPIATYESETKLYGTISHFSIWSAR